MRYNSTITVSRIFPRPSIEVSTDFIESEKVRRLCRFVQNLPPTESIQPENLFPFTSVQWTIRLRKQATDGKESSKTNNNLNRLIRSIQISFVIQKRNDAFILQKKMVANGKLHSLQKSFSCLSMLLRLRSPYITCLLRYF